MNVTVDAPVRLDLSTISLVAVDTVHPPLALWALRRCLRMARFREAVLVTSPGHALTGDPPADGIEVRHTESVRSIEDYSRFMLFELPDHVQGTHVLVVQWDGFIAHPECWSDDFLNYDYIGALWRRTAGHHRVGNGGFSLRSRRLLDAVRRLAPQQCHPEDAVIGEHLRHRLEAEHGIRFPPDPVAERFAFERDRLPFDSFGFHRYDNFPLVLSADEMRAFLALAPDAVAATRGVTRLVRRCTEQGMPDIARDVLARRRRAGIGHPLANALMQAWTHLVPARARERAAAR